MHFSFPWSRPPLSVGINVGFQTIVRSTPASWRSGVYLSLVRLKPTWISLHLMAARCWASWVPCLSGTLTTYVTRPPFLEFVLLFRQTKLIEQDSMFVLKNERTSESGGSSGKSVVSGGRDGGRVLVRRKALSLLWCEYITVLAKNATN